MKQNNKEQIMANKKQQIIHLTHPSRINPRLLQRYISVISQFLDNIPGPFHFLCAVAIHHSAHWLSNINKQCEVGQAAINSHMLLPYIPKQRQVLSAQLVQKLSLSRGNQYQIYRSYTEKNKLKICTNSHCRLTAASK